ncbi:MAG: hypothetical protein WBA52_01245 [Dolichospermum sp.]
MIKINISTPPIIAKTLAVSGFAASVLLAATPAHAISFNFSFQDRWARGTNGFVTGTLSGLVEGNNPGPGITATVTSSPGGQGVGSGYSFLNRGSNANAFVVSMGSIIYADLRFSNGSDTLNIATIDSSSYYPALYGSGNTYIYLDNSPGVTTFTSATPTPVPFEPNPAVGGAILGFCFGAAKLRRNHLAKKRMVSVEA